MAFPSTFADLQTAVLGKLRMNASDTPDVNRVKDWINQAYAQVCVETEANQTWATMALTPGSYSYALPAGVVRVKEMFLTPVAGVAQTPLLQTDLDEILRRRVAAGGPTVATGSVTHYAVLGSDLFEVYPTPAAVDTITIYYVSLPAALSSGADVPGLQEPYASKLLEYGALVEGADYKNDPSEMTYRSIYEDWLRRYRGHLQRKKGNRAQQFDVVGAQQFPPHDPSTDSSS